MEIKVFLKRGYYGQIMAEFTLVYVLLYPPPPPPPSSCVNLHFEACSLGGRCAARCILRISPAHWSIREFHFPKEDVSVLLRHRNPPYIPDFTFHCVALAVPPFLLQVCLAPLLLRLFNRWGILFFLDIPLSLQELLWEQHLWFNPCRLYFLVFLHLPDPSWLAFCVLAADVRPVSSTEMDLRGAVLFVFYGAEAHRESMQVLKLSDG